MVSGYRNQNIPRSWDAVKGVDCCCLSLQSSQDPVVSPDGFLFGHRPIVEYILQLLQKKKRERDWPARSSQAPGLRSKESCCSCDQVGDFWEKEEVAIVSQSVVNPSRSQLRLRGTSQMMPDT